MSFLIVKTNAWTTNCKEESESTLSKEVNIGIAVLSYTAFVLLLLVLLFNQLFLHLPLPLLDQNILPHSLHHRHGTTIVVLFQLIQGRALPEIPRLSMFN